MAEGRSPTGDEPWMFDDFVVDRARFSVRKGGADMALTPRAFDVLAYLIENRGRVVEKQELFDRIWKGTFVTDAALSRGIKEIRRALGDDAAAPRYVETVHKRGYRFIAELQVGEPRGVDSNQAALQPAPALPLLSPRAMSRPLKAIALAIGTLCIAGAAAAFWRVGRSVQIEAVAVLPFVTVNVDSETEFLGEGITSGIANRLTGLPRLRVAPLSRTARFKSQNVDIAEAGRALGVDAVLSGRLVRDEGRIQIQTELVDVKNASRLWGGQYDRPMSDVAFIEREIAREVSERLGVDLTVEERARLMAVTTEDPEAYQLFLRGQYFWNKRTAEGLQKSIDYYREAIDRDPGYAKAYSGLAQAYGVLGGLRLLPPDIGFGRSKAALEKALTLDPELAEAHYGLGIVNLLYGWDWQAAERAFARAKDLDPKVALPHGLYSYYLTFGRVPEALAEARRVLAQDPLSLPFARDVAETLLCARDYDQTIDVGQQMVEMDPNYPLSRMYVGLAYAHKGQFDRAFSEMERSVALSGRNPEHLGVQGYVYARAGRRVEAERLIARLTALSRERHVPATSVALIYVGLGETDPAFDWLAKAYDSRDIGLVSLYLRANPVWDSVRTDVRFNELLTRMKLGS